jgi:hypothetical protein
MFQLIHILFRHVFQKRLAHSQKVALKKKTSLTLDLLHMYKVAKQIVMTDE